MFKISISSKRIEELAVNIVKNLFLFNCDRITPEIPDNDRSVSFDGKLILNSNGDDSKKSYLSSIPVQVKGQSVQKYSNEKMTYYNIDYHTFDNFQIEDGAVLFVVEINPEKLKLARIYYKYLDTNELEDIKKYIIENENKKQTMNETLLVDIKSTRKIELNFLNEDMDLYAIFENIAIERKINSYGMTKLINKNNSISSVSNILDDKIIKGMNDKVNEVSLNNIDSPLNILLNEELDKILARFFIIDMREILKVLQYDKALASSPKLNPLTRTKINLVLAVHNYNMYKYDEAREILDSIEIEYRLIKFYEIFLIINASLLSFDEFNNLLNQHIPEENHKTLLIAFYYIQNGQLVDFYKILPENWEEVFEWLYLYSLYKEKQSLTSDINIIYEKLLEKSDILDFKIKNLIYKFQHTLAMKNRNSSTNLDLNNFLIEIKSLNNLYNKDKNFPILLTMQFEIENYIYPNEQLKIIERLIKTGESSFNKEDLFQWKVQVLISLKKYTQAEEFLETILREHSLNKLIIANLYIKLYMNNENTEKLIKWFEFYLANESKKEVKSAYFLSFLSTLSQNNTASSYLEKVISKYSKDVKTDYIINIKIEITRFLAKSKKVGEKYDDILKELLDNYEIVNKDYFIDFYTNYVSPTYFNQIFDRIFEIDYMLADKIKFIRMYNMNDYENVILIGKNNYDLFNDVNLFIS
ncbi:hypothetical protein ERX35_008425, partial [Macrococcus equipercicus]